MREKERTHGGVRYYIKRKKENKTIFVPVLTSSHDFSEVLIDKAETQNSVIVPMNEVAAAVHWELSISQGTLKPLLEALEISR